MMGHLRDQGRRATARKERENDGQKREMGRRTASGATCGPLIPAVSGAQEILLDPSLTLTPADLSLFLWLI